MNIAIDPLIVIVIPTLESYPPLSAQPSFGMTMRNASQQFLP